MSKRAVVALLAVGAMMALQYCAPASAAAALEPDAACKSLERANFLDVIDAPTQVLHAKLVAASEKIPSFCQVDGYVAPQVGFELRLPVSTIWNRNVLVVGTGGWGGILDGEACNAYVRRGYACITSDTGHRGNGDDGLWASNNLQAQLDFGFRAVHVTTLAAKAMLARYYAQPAKKSYFVGCSTGGYEGLVEAQRFPWDFDGILAGAPDMDELELTMRELWGAKQILDSSGHRVLDDNAIALLHRAALAECDLDDGLADGIISNPIGCQVHPSRLICKAEQTGACLTPSQAEAAQRIYAGPPMGNGQSGIGGALPGSELLWNNDFQGLGTVGPAAAKGLFTFMIYGMSPVLSADHFEFDRDYKRFGLGAFYNATNPDLRRFKSAGGKLLVYQGGNDIVEMPHAIVDYYETTERTMGGRASTQQFFRLFIVPGTNHCSGGAGAYAIDYLSYLEAWVQEDHPPETVIGAHVSEAYLTALPLPNDIGSAFAGEIRPEMRIPIAAGLLQFPLDRSVPVTFTRPVYPYPAYAKYRGRGNTNNAANFAPVRAQ